MANQRRRHIKLRCYSIADVGDVKINTDEYYLLDEVTGDLKEDAKKEGRDYQPNVKDNQLLIQFELSF